MSWLQRRRNRHEAAVLGALIQGDSYLDEIKTRIGGTSYNIRAALLSFEDRYWLDRHSIRQTDGTRRWRYLLTEAGRAGRP